MGFSCSSVEFGMEVVVDYGNDGWKLSVNVCVGF